MINGPAVFSESVHRDARAMGRLRVRAGGRGGAASTTARRFNSGRERSTRDVDDGPERAPLPGVAFCLGQGGERGARSGRRVESERRCHRTSANASQIIGQRREAPVSEPSRESVASGSSRV